MPYNDNKLNYSQTEFAVYSGFWMFVFLKLNIPICPLRGMSYNDTQVRKRAVLAELIQSNFINTLWRFLQRRTATKAIVSSPSHLL